MIEGNESTETMRTRDNGKAWTTNKLKTRRLKRENEKETRIEGDDRENN